MDLLDIVIAKQLAGGGGGSGTDNYNDLSNLPKINDTTLSGNKSSSALGLQSEINSDSKLASDLVDDTNQDNKFVTSTEKNTWNGKQNAIDADHKINADYVDDSTSTNKFVTASDKETWNAKQNAIDNSHKLSSDLVDDTNHTNKFVTSSEKQTWNAKQNAIDADHKLSSSLVSFSTAEAAALASGIDSTKVGQISTNQTNILYALRKVGTNMFNFEAWANNAAVTNYGTKSVSENTITISATNNSDTYTEYSENRYPVDARIPVNAGDKLYMSWNYSSADNVTGNVYIFGNASTSSMANANATDGHLEYTVPASGISYITMRVGLGSNQSGKSGTWSNIQIIMKSAYDAGLTNFTPYALPNYDLTRLQSEDRASLAEVVDSGAKNLLDTSTKTIYDMTFTKGSDEYVTVSPSTTDSRSWSYQYSQYFVPLNAGRYVLVVDIKTATTDSHNAAVRIYGQTSGELYISETLNDKTGTFIIEFTMPKTENCGIMSKQWNGAYRYMLCTKAAFCLSPKFVPYRYDPYTSVVQNVKNTTLYAKRNGRTITVNGYVDNISFTAGSSTTLGTINDEIGKPLQQVRSICSIGANAYSFGESAYLAIAPDGNVVVTPKTYTGTGAVFFSVSYTI